MYRMAWMALVGRRAPEPCQRRFAIGGRVEGKRAKFSLWLAVLGLAATVFFVPTAQAEQPGPDIALLPTSHPPYREIDTLGVNHENLFRGLVVANEAAGLVQVLNLAGRSRFEEQWAFVPALSIWIEIGINERSSHKDAEVEIDVAYLRRIVALFPEVLLVHFHPASFYPAVIPVGYPASFMAADVAAIGYALPSASDVLASIRLMELLHADNPDVQVAFAVISPHGVVSYGATETGRATIIYEGNNPRAGTTRSIVTRAAIRRMPFNVTETVTALGSPDIGDVIAELCAQFSDENYTATYSPVPGGTLGQFSSPGPE
jgi:hypothetical protein